MQAAKPLLDILIHCDDLEAAFRRVLYHPGLAAVFVVFAYIFLDYLILPVGQVFGSHSVPSYFSLLSDLRAEVASTIDLTPDGGPLECLAATAGIGPLPHDCHPVVDLTPACTDPMPLPLSPAELLCFATATFVDDNGIAAYCPDIRTSLHQNVCSVYIMFGFPEDNHI
jgi:hypothetical protein